MPQTLLAAVKDGTVKESTIDDKVLRLLRTELRYGFTRSPAVRSRRLHLLGGRPRRCPAGRAREHHPAQERRPPSAARRRKDQDHRRHRSRRLAGGPRRRRLVGGDSLSSRSASSPASPTWSAPDVHVLYTRGLPEMNDVFWQTHWEGGVKVATYPSKDFTGTPETTSSGRTSPTTRTSGGDRRTRLRAASATPLHYKAEKAGKYLILAAASGDDDYTVKVDGKQLLAPAARRRPGVPSSGHVDLNAGADRQRGRRLSARLRRRCALAWALPIEPDLISEEAKAVCVAWRMSWWSPSASILQPRARATTAPSRCPGDRTR